MEEIDRKIMEEIRKSERDAIAKLAYIGESAVNEARENGDYMDQTGNLRSSIGYAVLDNGKVVIEDTKLSERGSDKMTGLNTGKTVLQELSERYKKNFTLIVEAGMDYAVYVEALGKNVLSSSKLLAESKADNFFGRKNRL